jgi:hypothetical protein
MSAVKKAASVAVSEEFLPITRQQLAEAMTNNITAEGVWRALRGKRRAQRVRFIVDRAKEHRWRLWGGSEIVATGEGHASHSKAKRAALALLTAPKLMVESLESDEPKAKR